MSYFYDWNDYEEQDLRAERRFERQRANRLALNPDCRDPDHPGCEDCMEGDDDEATA
jgi:hypothetical protein